ncbi:MAG: thioredoxin domain-containing protein, partial [Oscillospiraceae bacterium]|nr:thioredoxin domain-containing protein [Oscillospiraceae bacterium]
CYERRGDAAALEMAEHTLLQMYRGGLFDHMGFGFCRYSTDERFLVPHFEKMLYDNALLILAYCKAYAVKRKPIYRQIAEKTAAYVLREMTSPSGGFYSAQDADSDGVEGKYYLLTPSEIQQLLGKEDGARFCRHFDITDSGNFEGKSIPNLLDSDPSDRSFEPFLERICQYRKERCALHLDDKILTSWNALMIAALCQLYQVSGNVTYLNAAKQADQFIQIQLCDEYTLYVSTRKGKRGVKGFLDDYAAYIFAQLCLYGATLEQGYLDRAERLCRETHTRFWDKANGGFYLYGTENESLILRPKESYDGAIPSGNSFMAWNLVRLSQLTDKEIYRCEAAVQLQFLAARAERYPIGQTMFLLALLDEETPPPKIVVVAEELSDAAELPLSLPLDAVVRLQSPTEAYPLKNGKTTYYVCRGHACLPPTNDWQTVLPRS